MKLGSSDYFVIITHYIIRSVEKQIQVIIENFNIFILYFWKKNYIII